jgi:hypothetical protein
VTVRHAAREDNDSASLVLYPDHPSALELELERTPPRPADGFAWLVDLELRPDDPRLPLLPLELELH